VPECYGENIIVVYDLISDTLCITTPVLDKLWMACLPIKTSGRKEKNVFKIFVSYQFYLYINVISVLCNLNGTLFQTCLILHVWLKSIILVFANILNTFFSFLPTYPGVAGSR
jgi:hypothetical protein